MISENYNVTSIKLNITNITVMVGDDFSLVATCTPDAVPAHLLTWESSKEKVAVVDSEGEVSALSEGSARITVSYGSVKRSCIVIVKKADGTDPGTNPGTDPGTNPDTPDVPDPEDPADDTPTGTKGVGEFPTIYIDLKASSVDRDNPTNTTITFKDPSSWYTSVPELKLTCTIRGRGNMSWGSFQKKPYKIKLDVAHRVLGMNRNRDWDLIANANDHILLRNSIGYHISKKMEFDWTPKYRFVELYMNNEYRGTYILVQHKEVASEKVNITPATPTTAPEEGGYYIEVEDKGDGRGEYLSSRYKMPVWWNDPSVEDGITEAQKQYVSGIIETIEDGLYNKDFKKVWDNLEMRPMVDYFILKELAKDIDGCVELILERMLDGGLDKVVERLKSEGACNLVSLVIVRRDGGQMLCDGVVLERSHRILDLLQ